MMRIAMLALCALFCAPEAMAQPGPGPGRPAEGRAPRGDGPPLRIRDISSFHVGGRIAELSGLPEREIVFSPGAPPLRINPNGQFQVEQMYAQVVRLQNPRARYPIILAHGGGLTGVTYETTPDGRPGWQMFFLRAGHDVVVTDAVERGRSGWARSPEIFAGEPVFRTMGEGWGRSAWGCRMAGTSTRPSAAPSQTRASRWRHGTSSWRNPCRAGPPPTGRCRPATTRWCSASAPA